MKCSMKHLFLLLSVIISFHTTAKDSFTHCWSHYTGWEPWAYAESSGIVKKWANKYGIEINVQLINDYIESINLFTTTDACDSVTATNMDALTIPAVGGIDTTAIIVGDYSNGNDGIVAKNADSLQDLKGRTVRLAEFSVSHYMLSRALDSVGMKERNLKVQNQSDADIAAVFLSDKNGAVVTWNPPLQVVLNSPGAKKLFDSSQIPGEIIDITFAKTDGDERFKKALTGAWFETLAIINSQGKQSKEAIEFMASNSGATIPEFKAQLKTTAMFYTAKEAVDFTGSDELIETMNYVRQFSFDNGLYGNGAPSADLVGIKFPSGEIVGDKNNVKLRFSNVYMKAAQNNTL